MSPGNYSKDSQVLLLLAVTPGRKTKFSFPELIHIYIYFYLKHVILHQYFLVVGLFSIRFYLESPQAKSYFVHFKLTPDSANLKTHGAKIMNAFRSAAKHLDDLADNLSPLKDLGVDSGNFGVRTIE